MLIYREQSSSRSTRELCAEIAASDGLSALLRAAELECALADLGHPAEGDSARLCDDLARALLDGKRPRSGQLQCALELPSELTLKRPEGYAYYGLDPRSYALAAHGHRARSERAVVIGVRSIGTSLSAVFSAALSARGLSVTRFTVRPSGHPFRRELRWDGAQQRLIASELGSEYFVVDEGPGLSGSTFLSVAEALAAHGVPPASIVLCPSHDCDASRLLAEDGAARWARYQKLVAVQPEAPAGAVELSAGAWRQRVFSSESAWPAIFQHHERRKFLLPGELHKFSGLPPYDAGALARSELLCEAGFGPRVRRAAPGYLAFDWCAGRAAYLGDRAAVPGKLAAYLALRARELGQNHSDVAALAEMTRVNASEALGADVGPVPLPVELPLLADARLQPHEWIIGPGGEWTKVDGADHGDDHLFPGPVDVAWDLAGAAVEWQLDPGAVQALLAGFRRASGHDASRRFPAYVLAYLAFRVGVIVTAELSAAPSELGRLAAEKRYYRTRLTELAASF